MHRKPNGAALVRYGPRHDLPDPPGGVGGEAEAPVGVELLHSLHEPYVSLLDEVLKGQAVAAVLLGHRDNQPEVLLYEPLTGASVTLLGPPAEIYLLLVGQQI